MTDDELLMIESMILASGIIAADHSLRNEYNTIYLTERNADRIDSIIDYSTRICKNRIKKLKHEISDNDTVFCGDLVILSIDGGEPERYYINRYGFKPCDLGNYFVNLPVYTDLGKKILNKHIGETVYYDEDNDKNEHNAKILSIVKTAHSIRYNDYEIEVDERWREKNGK